MKNLQNFGVQELNAKEIREIDGGALGEILAVIGAIIYLYNEGPDFINSFSSSYIKAERGGCPGAGGSW